VFGPTQAVGYWSSATLAGGSSSAWYVYFGKRPEGPSGGDAKSNTAFVRAVRAVGP